MSPRKRSSDNETTEAAVAETSAPESEAATQGFADRVGQTKRTVLPDPFAIAIDNVAGVRLYESRQDKQMALMFGEGRIEDKPSQAVIDRLKEAGYRWNPGDKIWAHPVAAQSAMTTRIEAKQLYDDLCNMIRQEKGTLSEQGIPF